MKKLLKGLLLVFLTIVISGCGAENNNEASSSEGSDEGNNEETQYISIGGSPVELPYYQVASGISTVLDENLDNVSATAETTGGAIENALRVTEGDMEMSITDSRTALESLHGEGDFEGQGDNIRSIMSFYRTYAQIIALGESDIETLSDLKGKRVGMGANGSASQFVIKQLLDMAGIKEDDLDPFYIPTGEAVEMMQNGQLDAAIQTGPLGVAPFLDLSSSRDVSLVQIEEDVLDQYLEKFPYEQKDTVPGGTYEGIEEDIETIRFSHSIIAQKELDEDLVYDMTKTIYENTDELEKVHSMFENVDKETFNVDELAIPLHPGALRYYEEEGVPLEKYQEEIESLQQ
ncbi:TAXI family TRAP transporter solute-binding subunit [Alteribacillus sp. YIM 98480]|uniref:TAXI family TRAP transporter solute-binding subunit n=1 Tax=Alteribacillus sp. YIM 98480 TaxID=2606599 RepID=UPI00131AE417|nr:TAXI family TRAP transporter solute-binding subunit [Alteribacillus sp. YIM 98480]